ncbi:EAL domain-containing protein [Demequina sp. TTPB684]|uniref:putative bifunctional diguanylate cyclase/phosphodiesterase n=1 Tax=unclassified Demequina TaxID=2620311 RepID=UPI001CF38B56|nr:MULTISPECIES: GGDEF domain-containing protein [unclassified Demequina]MCB2412100.1 EAL domain-containing protein [Demequina sp. TTPB684]UPU88529.1 EAL domain-containing protein [Demequina sp. TMPB413]
MTDLSAVSPQRLVVFLTELGRCATSVELTHLATELIAEEFDGELGLVLSANEVISAVGFGSSDPPAELLLSIPSGVSVVEIPGIGPCHTMTATCSAFPGGRIVAGRVGAPYTSGDRDLFLGMARVFDLTTSSIRALERERARHRALEVLLALQRSISHRVPLAKILLSVTEGASSVLRGCPVALVLDDALDPGEPVHVGADLERVEDAVSIPVHVQGAIAGRLLAGASEGTRLTDEDRALLSTFAEHASLALTDARTVEAMREAFHDPLTGLPNRPLFLDRLTAALDKRDAGPLAVLFVDLDRFKAVNDTMGHAAGDELLLQVAERIRSTTRTESSAARFGGDEFALMVECHAEPGIAIHVAQRVIAALAEPFTVRGNTVLIGATVGIAFSGNGRDAAELLADADLAMYRAKRAGGGRSATFESKMRDELASQLSLASDLTGALGRKELSVHFQPIFDLDSGRPVAVEALLRWQHPTRGTVSPTEFIPVAESTGLIVPIGRWVLGQACGWASKWRSSLAALKVTVNVSVHQLREPGFATEVIDTVAGAGLPPNALIVEVTESALIADHDGTIDSLEHLERAGITIALDDFGTGYSALSYLHKLPLDVLKIDRSFVSGAQGTQGDQLVRTIIDLGQVYGLEVVAEGIEDEAQLDRLLTTGCRFGQGYFLARPAAPEGLIEKLEHLDQGHGLLTELARRAGPRRGSFRSRIDATAWEERPGY